MGKVAETDAEGDRSEGVRRKSVWGAVPNENHTLTSNLAELGIDKGVCMRSQSLARSFAPGAGDSAAFKALQSNL